MDELFPPVTHRRDFRALESQHLLESRGAHHLAAGAVPVVDEAGQRAGCELQSRLAGLERHCGVFL